MQIMKSEQNLAAPRVNGKLFYIAILLVIMLAVGIYIKNIVMAVQTALPSKGSTLISQSVLEEKYGLHVNLIAVTASGGMVDLRLKMLDGEKARLLLQDKKNFPALLINNNLTLNASEDTKDQELKFEKGGGLFLLFPNSGNAVKPGSTIAILFGDTKLESVVVR
jgi:hypothetical protein